jgi:hypothetical protein
MTGYFFVVAASGESPGSAAVQTYLVECIMGWIVPDTAQWLKGFMKKRKNVKNLHLSPTITGFYGTKTEDFYLSLSNIYRGLRMADNVCTAKSHPSPLPL